MSTNLDPRNVTVGEAAPAEPRTEAQITADLERQRAELAATIDQLYARVQPAALAQEAKDEARARFASFKESASLTLQDAAGGNTEALKKVGVVALSVVGILLLIVLILALVGVSSLKSAQAHRPDPAASVAATKEAIEKGLGK